jgi:hypothetical protein
VFFLNWKAVGHTSTVDPDWFMRWYFNFGNREGLAHSPAWLTQTVSLPSLTLEH